MTLEIPQLVILADGTTAQVKGVAASVVDGRLEQVVYTVEKQSGAWTNVAAADVRLSDSAERIISPTGDAIESHPVPVRTVTAADAIAPASLPRYGSGRSLAMPWGRRSEAVPSR